MARARGRPTQIQTSPRYFKVFASFAQVSGKRTRPARVAVGANRASQQRRSLPPAPAPVVHDRVIRVGLCKTRVGVDEARRGWLEPKGILNTRSQQDLRNLLRKP